MVSRQTESTLSDEQLHTLRHMLGINTPADRVPIPYRNHAAVSPGDHKYIELENLGMVECLHRAGELEGFSDYDLYICTGIGRLEAMGSHQDIRYSPGRRRYLRFLSTRDAVPGLTFREFLTDTEYYDVRTGA